jgi:hypothetical protein
MKKKASKPKKSSVRIKDLQSKSNPKGGRKAGGMRGNTIGGANVFTKIDF